MTTARREPEWRFDRDAFLKCIPTEGLIPKAVNQRCGAGRTLSWEHLEGDDVGPQVGLHTVLTLLIVNFDRFRRS